VITSPAVRKLTLAVHLTVSVGWIGAVAAYIPFDVATITGGEAQALRVAYLAMELISRSVIVPLALASLVTGLVVSLGTKWGLFRHYWVLISLAMTTMATAVLLIERRTISALADVAADPATSGDALRLMPSTLLHSLGGTVVLLVILALNIFKPRGLTRYGWRKQQADRLKEPGRDTAPVP
jgi:hypothetical protein